MQLQNNEISKKQFRIAYLGALTLLLSYVEMLLPKIFPFFRIGLGNSILLLAFDLNFPSFVLLNFIKIFTNAVLSGTLFSPFVLVSIAQGFCSGLVMYGIARIPCRNKLISIIGISIIGAAVSAFVQIYTSGLYLGQGTFALIGPMLIFSVFAGIITAVVANFLNIPQTAPVLILDEECSEKKSIKTCKLQKFKIWIMGVLILVSLILIMLVKSIVLLGIILIVSFIFQMICGRKIKLLPHFSLWIFILLCTIFTPNGKVLLKIGNLSVTSGALFDGVEKAIKLSAVSAISQGLAGFKFSTESNSIFAITLLYFKGLSDVFRKSNDRLFQKIQTIFSINEIKVSQTEKSATSLIKVVFLTISITSIFILSCFLT